ncbi:MAG: radical SAM family heme chaperone HemW [Thermodesulfobacteriota bacterium]
MTGLYLHLPFCPDKCLYCSFNSRPAAGQDLHRYLDALESELARMADHPWSRSQTFTSLYLGGGTPTIFPVERLAALLGACLDKLPFTTRPEISIEANPDTVSVDTLATLRQAGVNRLSIGVQSFSDPLLCAIGRTHSAAAAGHAFHAARRAGFTNINLDLIYGLPGQTGADWHASLAAAVALAPEHLCIYQLMVEPGSLLHRRIDETPLPDEDELVEMDRLTGLLLRGTDYRHYEISNFCRPGRQCRHNLNYWQNGSYLGLGAGAVSCFDGLRLKAVDDASEYVRRMEGGIPVYEEGEALSALAAYRETVVMGLRMTDGIDLVRLRRRFALTPDEVYGDTLARLAGEGWLERDGDTVRLSAAALPIANGVLCRLV